MPEQQVQRRRRQHDAEPGEAGGDAFQFAPALRAEDDGRGDAGQQRQFALADAGEIGQRGGVQAHDREGLGFALLAFAQFGNGGWVARIAGEVEAAQALDRDDISGAQQAQGFADGVAGQRLAGRIEQAQLRAAIRAAGGFGMETAVSRGAVFDAARRAEREGSEAGLRPIVGDAPADRVTRAAMSAGGEGVAPAAASRVAEVGDAVGADAGVGADGGLHLAGFAVEDGKTFAADLGGFVLDGVDAGQTGRFQRQAFFENWPIFAADRSNHPAAVVAHPAVQAEFGGEAPDVGSKADALNQATDAEQPSCHPIFPGEKPEAYAEP